MSGAVIGVKDKSDNHNGLSRSPSLASRSAAAADAEAGPILVEMVAGAAVDAADVVVNVDFDDVQQGAAGLDTAEVGIAAMVLRAGLDPSGGQDQGRPGRGR